MAYEYESKISSLIIDNPSEIDGYAYDEIKEVYRKAKAFDEVIKNVKTEFVSQDLADATRTLVYDYEYEKEDE